MDKKKVILVVMDGVGITEEKFGNALVGSKTPNLDKLMRNYPYTLIHAHGTYVGLPSLDDMGNSEVGHNAMGCGQIYSQGAKLVDEAIKNKKIFLSSTWKDITNNCKENGVLHFIGLLSDGGVHSHIEHLFSLMEEAKKSGVKEARIHILLDGRDVEEKSALKYVDMLENKIKELNDSNFHSAIASGGGRMIITMDRYEANWKMVEDGWHIHVLGDGRKFASAKEAIEVYRSEENVSDQYLPGFVISENDKPIGTINDGDSVIFFNFRGDRALEISEAFESDNFDKFNRIRFPKIMFAGMLQYDSDLEIPKKFLTEPPKISNTLTEELNKYNIREYAISETQKFGHMTYFWNGNKLGKFNDELETYEEVASDVIPFDQAPKMKSYEITDKLINAIRSNKYDFLRINFPNGDMVGHTGNYEKTVESLEAVDENIGRIMKVVDETDGILIVTADHGNAEEMYQLKDKTKKIAKTSHTTNPVPFILYGKDIDSYKIKHGDFGLANIASTITTLFKVEKNPNWLESIIEED